MIRKFNDAKKSHLANIFSFILINLDLLNLLGLILPNYSIGSDFKSIEAALSYEFSYTFKPLYITKTNQALPIIIDQEKGKIEQAIWGLRGSSKAQKIYPWIRSEGIIKKQPTRALIRHNRCLIPANGFFIQHAPGNNYFIYFPKNKIITFGGIWKILKDKELNIQTTVFAIISCPSNGKISGLTNRVPLVIHPGARRNFLKKEKPLMDITRLLKKENNLDFNGVPVSSEIFRKPDISKSDFLRSKQKLLKNREFPEKSILGSYYYHQS